MTIAMTRGFVAPRGRALPPRFAGQRTATDDDFDFFFEECAMDFSPILLNFAERRHDYILHQHSAAHNNHFSDGRLYPVEQVLAVSVGHAP